MTEINRLYSLFTAALSILTMNALLPQVNAQTWDFQYGYANVFAPNALDYTVEQFNIQRGGGGGDETYWYPVNNGTEARLTQRFTFARPTTEVNLFAKLCVWDFGGGNYGWGSLWGSNDGASWTLIVDAPTPPFNATYSPTDFPDSLIGSDELWIQARLQTSGMNILAQYGRTAWWVSENVFELDANLIPEPSSALLAFGGLALLLVRRMTKRAL
jgi:hypothetical protein